jgi:two-component system, OmpR family, sensor histidine kinase CreC
MLCLSVRILLGYFLIVALAGVLLLRVVADQIRPSVRETIEEVMIDSANWLAALASRDFDGGQFIDRNFSSSLVLYAQRELNANVGTHIKQRIDFDIYLTDRQGKVVFDSTGQWLGQDFSRWRNVHRTLKGEYGARSTRTVSNDETSSVYHVSAPIFIKRTSGATELAGTLTVAKPVSSVTPIIEKARRQIYWQGGLLILGALLIGLLKPWPKCAMSIDRMLEAARTENLTAL